jgi:phosphoglycerate dehydrogenase-like enzyme
VIQAADLEGFDALILLIPRIEPESFPKDGRLAIIARFGVGYDTVNVQACTDNGCALAITPDGVRRPVAVSIITFMLALTGKLFAKDQITRQGPTGWAQRNEHMGVGLVGRTLGSLGIGNIGAEVFRLARPFDMKFIAHDPYAEPAVARDLGVRLVGLEQLFADPTCCQLSERGDAASSSRAPRADEAERVSDQHLARPGDRRGGADRSAAGGQIAGAGLDVLEQERAPSTIRCIASTTSSSRRMRCAGPISASPGQGADVRRCST